MDRVPDGVREAIIKKTLHIGGKDIQNTPESSSVIKESKDINSLIPGGDLLQRVLENKEKGLDEQEATVSEARERVLAKVDIGFIGDMLRRFRL